MALKKRGFNVDRLLNQEREDRLRIRAEEEQKHIARQKPVQQYPDDKQSVKSTTSGSGSSVVEMSTQKKSPFNGNGLIGKLPSFMNSMPGAFNPNKRGSSSGPRTSKAGQDQIARGPGSAAGPAPGHTTKEVRSWFSPPILGWC